MVRALPLLLLLLAGCASSPDPLPESRPFVPAPAERGDATRSADRIPDDLPGLVALALERNPRIRAARERAVAMEEGAREVGWLPNPSVVVGWYAVPVETRVGPQNWSLSLRQPVPFPTKLRTRSEIGDAEARRARVVYERTVRDVLTAVIRAAWEIAYLDEAKGISDGIAALLERYVADAAGEEGPLSDLFRAQTQRAQLENDRVVLAELRVAESVHLRSLLALPPDTPIATPRLSPVPRVRVRWEDLLARMSERNQEMIEAGLSLETAALRTSLAEQRRIPDLSLGVTRIFTGDITGVPVEPEDSGRDPLIFSLGLDIPLWIPKDSAAIRKARALERAAAEERTDSAQRARTRLARAWYRLGKAERLSRLYGEVLVPRARLATRTAEDLAAAGKGSLSGTLEAVAVLHNFRLAAARARSDHAQALADLEAAVGQPFVPAGEEAP
ncbi:MAG: TolC family protein [Planctomycetota bacterium]